MRAKEKFFIQDDAKVFGFLVYFNSLSIQFKLTEFYLSGFPGEDDYFCFASIKA